MREGGEGSEGRGARGGERGEGSEGRGARGGERGEGGVGGESGERDEEVKERKIPVGSSKMVVTVPMTSIGSPEG